MSVQDRYKQSIEAGYSDDEIIGFLSEQPEYSEKFKESRAAGYSDQDIMSFIARSPPPPAGAQVSQQRDDRGSGFNQEQEKSLAEKGSDLLKTGLRTVGQYALGAAETALLPYEVGVASLASKDAQNVAYRQVLGEDLERLLEQKATGVWDDQDESLLQSTIEQIKNPSKSAEFVQTADLSIQGLTEKATGLDLKPKGILEKAGRWVGWIKNPKNLAELSKSGISVKSLANAVMPSKTEAFRGVSAASALQAAEEGELGPIGTIAASIAADVAAGGAVGLGKSGLSALKSPKKAAAKAAASFTKTEQRNLQNSIIQDFKDSGIQADLGTITDSNLIRWVQSRLAQSGLTGSALDDMRNEITTQIKREYKSLADGIGRERFANTFEAGQAAKDMISRTRTRDLDEVRNIYKESSAELKEGAKVFTDGVISKVEELEKSLSPGAIKSAEQKAVLKAIGELKGDLMKTHPQGKAGLVKDLINNKRGIQDIINYEVQGGAKQLLKGVNAEIDRAIISHGVDNAKFANKYVDAQKRFATHAKTFRNKNIDQILRSEDPARVLGKMNSVQGIRDIKQALGRYQDGQSLFRDLKRFKLDEVIGNNMVDSTTKQVKLGTFSKLLEKGKNKDLIKEILGKSDFKRLEKLQTNAGRLANSANKFFNSSQSATAAADAVAVMALLKQTGFLLSGNPWPLAKGAAGAVGARRLSSLISDPEFLKLTEEAMRAFNSKNTKSIQKSMDRLVPYALEAVSQSKSDGDE